MNGIPGTRLSHYIADIHPYCIYVALGYFNYLLIFAKLIRIHGTNTDVFNKKSDIYSPTPYVSSAYKFIRNRMYDGSGPSHSYFTIYFSFKHFFSFWDYQYQLKQHYIYIYIYTMYILCNRCLSPQINVLSSRSDEVYSIQRYMIKFVSDLLRQVGGFLRETLVSSINKTNRHDIAEILLKVALCTTPTPVCLLLLSMENEDVYMYY